MHDVLGFGGDPIRSSGRTLVALAFGANSDEHEPRQRQ
jgi:hypothetical protein